jgi:mono/diheme cytochrome c family protein
MKYCLFIFFIVSLCLPAACSYEKKLGIDMPEGFSKERKQQVLQQFAEGKKAYLTHCAGCHNKTVNGKEVIPDISFEQADTYRVRFTNNQHKTELREETVTEQELDMIVIFFAYKKQSGVKAFEEKEEN